jgi:hypothetical protein
MIPTAESSALDQRGPLPNPFAVPNLGMKAQRPLVPIKFPDHAQRYLPVDHTESMFVEFQKYLPYWTYWTDRADGGAGLDGELVDNGRLIVVTGESECGKTSLINRCAHHLKSALDKDGGVIHEALVVDVMTQEPPPASFQDRDLLYREHARLAQMVATKLASKFEVFRPLAAELSADTIYANISSILAGMNRVAIILLPAFDDAVTTTTTEHESAVNPRHPAEHYLRLRADRLVFFAESQNPADVDRWYRHLRGDDVEDTLILRVGPLEGDDGWTFANGRITACQDDRVATVDRETMRDFVAGRGSIPLGHLQKLCFELWEDARQRPDVTEVTHEDILRIYESLTEDLPRRVPRPRNSIDGEPRERIDDGQ